MNIPIHSFMIIETTEDLTISDLTKYYGYNAISNLDFIAYQNVKGSFKYQVLKDKVSSWNYTDRLITADELSRLVL